MSEIFGDSYQGSTLITDTTHSQTMANTTGETVTAAMWSYLLDEVRGIQEVLGVPGRRGAAGKVSGSDTSIGTATASGTNLVFAATQTALTAGSLVSTATPTTHGWRRVVTSGGITCTLDSAFDDTVTSVLIYRHGTVTERIDAINLVALTNWTSFTMSIEGTSSNPAKASSPDVDKAYWRRVGDSMEIQYNYRQSASGGAGSGIYLFSIPSGYAIDTSKVDAGADGLTGCVGSASIASGSEGNAKGTVNVYDSTHLMLTGVSSTTYYVVQSSTYDLSDSLIKYSFRAVVPIVGWS